MKLSSVLGSFAIFISSVGFAAGTTNLWCDTTLKELQNADFPMLSRQMLIERAQDQVAAAELAKLFPKIKSKHRNRELGYADLNFSPEIKRVSKATLSDAIARIKSHDAVATTLDELTILDNLAFQTRKFLVTKIGGKPLYPLSPDLVRDWCFESTRFVRHRLAEIDDDLKMKVAFHDLRAFTGEYWPHYVAVVKFSSGRVYWLDFTWAQFDGSSNEHALVGKTLRASGPLGTLMANVLNAKGFFP